jgi:hypothetical protein
MKLCDVVYNALRIETHDVMIKSFTSTLIASQVMPNGQRELYSAAAAGIESAGLRERLRSLLRLD